MALGTTTTTANALKSYWSDLFIEQLYLNLALKGLTKRGTVPNGNGKVVYWVNIGKVHPVGAAGSEGIDGTARSTRATRVSAVLAPYQNLVTNSSFFMDTSIDGTKDQIMKDLAKDAAKTLDDTGLAIALAGSNVIFPGSIASRSVVVKASTATVRDVRNAVRLLQLSGATKFSDGNFVGLVHPDVAYDLQSDSAWTAFSQYRDTVKYDIDGEIGRFYGVRFAYAPSIPILVNSGSANCDIYRTLVFGPDYLGQADLGGLEIVMNEPSKSGELGLTCSYGYVFYTAFARLNEADAIRIESSASRGTN